MFKILSDKRFDEIGAMAIQNKVHKKHIELSSEAYKNLIELIKDSQEAMELLEDFESESTFVSAIENEIYYEQGFKDALKFLAENKGGV